MTFAGSKLAGTVAGTHVSILTIIASGPRQAALGLLIARQVVGNVGN